MNTLCITGAPGIDFESISAMLFQGGLALAQPVEREATISMADWHARVAPLLQRQQTPGRLWEQLAGDLLLANLHQTQWGWADPASCSALEFWAELEPGICFLLLTTEPQDYLAYCLLEESYDADIDEKACLQRWRELHERLLAFYLANPERCLLVNARQVRANPAALGDKLEVRWQFDLDLSTANLPVLPESAGQAAPNTLARYLADRTLQEHGRPLKSLREELQAAQYPLAEPEIEEDEHGNMLGWADLSLGSILKDYQRRCAQDLSPEEREALETLKQENQQLLRQLQQVQDELEGSVQQQQQLEQALAETQALLPASEAMRGELEESQQENELLLLQLHQVQEELESTFLAKRSLEAEKDSLRTQLEESRQSVKELPKSQQENERLQHQLHQVREELEGTVQKQQQLERELADTRAGLTASEKTSTELEEAKQENELLLLQLHQVQEELEHYFLQHQKISQDADKLKTENRRLKHQWQTSQQQSQAPKGWLARLGSGKRQTAALQLAYEGVRLRHEQVNPDYEHLWITLQDASFGEHYAPEWQFRLSCAGVKPDAFGQQPKLELPEQQEQLLQHWFAESESEHGRKLELRFALPNAMDTGVWKQIHSDDQAVIRSLLTQLPQILAALKQQGGYLSRDWADWEMLAADMQRIHQAKAKP